MKKAKMGQFLTWEISMKILMGLFLVMLMPLGSRGLTDSRDVAAINSLYVALENPPLPGWVLTGGDPCVEAWQGVQCVLSNITGIILNGAYLGGELGTNLNLFTSVMNIDLSDNHIGGSIPANLPNTLRSFLLSSNQFTGSIPSSLSSLSQLTDMSLSNNHLTGEIPDSFQALSSLVNLDLSSNNLSGQLPPSMASLSSMTTLHLQDNQLSGTLNVLQDLPLTDLDIENNIFSGPIPDKLLRIPNFRKDGNPFNTTVLPSPPLPQTPIFGAPTPGIAPWEQANEPSAQKGPAHLGSSFARKGFSKRVIEIAVAGLLIVIISVLLVLCFMSRSCKGKKQAERPAEKPGFGVFKTPVEKPQSACEEPVVSPKDEHRINIRRMGEIPNPRHREEAYMKKPWFASIQKKDHQLNISQTNSLMPPPVEKLSINPIVPTEISTRKPSANSLDLPFSVGPLPFSIASLQQYTNSFSEENCIGEGMLGSVYLAELPDGKLLAVKKLNNMTCMLQNDKEFLDLVLEISKLQHVNVVKLEGYCAEHGQRLLIFEHCSNVTLNDTLHSDGLTRKLTWNDRVRVALDAARALEYLHKDCCPPILHRNFKSANVLLDDKFAVRVSDCGLAPLISVSSVNQLSGHSSKGYEAPEFESGIYSCQSDVYSFGVVILELLTGRKPYDGSRPRGEQFLVRWATKQFHDIDALSRMVDPSLNGAYPAKSLSHFVDIISMCLRSEPEFRYSMSEVVQSLSDVIKKEAPIKR